MSCLGIDRYCRPCKFKIVNDTKCCKNHQYLQQYGGEELKNMIICTGCKKCFHSSTGSKTCDICKNRNKVNCNKKVTISCAKEGCKFKKSKDNKYCGIHQVCIFLDDVKERGMKACNRYTRGCRNVLDLNDKYSNCENCREMIREKDRQHREEKKSVEVVIEKDQKQCPTCYEVYNNSLFIGVKGDVVKTCKHCRDKNKIQDAKRDKEQRRAMGRVYDNKPERKEKKKEWEKNNYDKRCKINLISRQKAIQNGVGEYLKRNAENAKQWRINNPEKQKIVNENKRKDIKQQFKIYQRSATKKRLKFQLTYQDYQVTAYQPCYYCNDVESKGFNGIDRKDSRLGYQLENCVSSCRICNYMKGSCHINAFIGRVHHILGYHSLVDGKRLYKELFKDHINNKTQTTYKQSAIKRGKKWDLSLEDFKEEVLKPCSICGKENTDTHHNGIDRIDNSEGYVAGNIQSCCGECNYMKRELDMSSFVSKLLDIYDCHPIFEINPENSHENASIVFNTNKKTKAEIEFEGKLRIETNQKKLLERYSDKNLDVRIVELKKQRNKL